MLAARGRRPAGVDPWAACPGRGGRWKVLWRGVHSGPDGPDLGFGFAVHIDGVGALVVEAEVAGDRRAFGEGIAVAPDHVLVRGVADLCRPVRGQALVGAAAGV